MQQTQIIVTSILGIWLLVLSGLVVKILSQNRKKQSQSKKLTYEELTSSLKSLEGKIQNISTESVNYVQKIGIIRFNPFGETGGDQSFSICLLDKSENGVIISCLHTRERTRVYAKQIAKGKSELKLSKEEEKALLSARKKQ